MAIKDRLIKEERETILRIDEVDDCWIADTCIQKDINRFRKMGWEEFNTQYYEDGQVCSAMFKAPRFAITVRKPCRRKISDEQREAARQRFIEMHKEKNEKQKEVM